MTCHILPFFETEFRWQNLLARQADESAYDSAGAWEAVEQRRASEKPCKHPQAAHRYWMCVLQERAILWETGEWRIILYHQKAGRSLALSEQPPVGAV